MARILEEGNLQFDFSDICFVTDPIKFDTNNPTGTEGVDFIAETKDRVYFIEVKDYQNPDATAENRKIDFEMLIAAGKEKPDLKSDYVSRLKGAIFCLQIGQKFKDSLLRKLALGEIITKKIEYLIFINLDNLGEKVRGRLKEKISGYIPTGLNSNDFTALENIAFKLVDKEQMKSYNITCTHKS